MSTRSYQKNKERIPKNFREMHQSISEIKNTKSENMVTNNTNISEITQLSLYCRTCFILFFKDIFNYIKIEYTKLVY